MDADDFARAGWLRRRGLRRQRRLAAEWVLGEEPAGSVVLQLRMRARESQTRALVFLVLLFLTVLLGLGYFVGVPLWQEWTDKRLNAERAREEAAIAAGERAVADRLEALKAALAEQAGLRWRRVGAGLAGDVVALHIVPDGAGWALSRQAGPFTTADAGQTWSALRVAGLTAGPQDGPAEDAREDDDDDDEDDGDGAAPAGDYRALVRADSGALYLLGSEALAVAAPDGTWRRGAAPPFGARALAVARTGPAQDRIAIAGPGGVRIATADWADPAGAGDPLDFRSAAFLPGQRDRVRALAFDPEGRLWAVGTGGLLAVRTEAGETLFDAITDEDLFAIAFAGPAGTAFALAVGEEGTVLRSADGGRSWAEIEAGSAADLLAVDLLDSGEARAVGAGGTMLRSLDGGASWQPEPSGVVAALGAVQIASPDLAFAAGEDGVFLAGRRMDADAFGTAGSAEALLRAVIDAGQVPGPALGALAEEEAALARRRARLDALSITTPAEAAVSAAASLALAAQDEASRARAMTALDVALAQAEGGQDWWRYAADRVPAGILILFLLATLGALYRYNSRMSGFYHARADVLELVALDLDGDRIDRLAATLAADKVEFKDVRTPADIAAEITKEVLAKMPRG